MARRSGKQLAFAAAQPFRDKLEASAALAGLPIYAPQARGPYGETARLPGLCRKLIQSEDGIQCRRFHSSLNEEAQQSPVPVVRTCPAGLCCFGLRMPEGLVAGGHVRCRLNGALPTGPVNELGLYREVPEIPKERLEGLLDSLPRLLGASSSLMARLEPEVHTLLNQRQPLEKALTRLCELLVKRDVCEGAMIGSFVEGDLRIGCSGQLQGADAAKKLWQSACKGKARRSYRQAQLRRLGLEASAGLMLPLGDEELQGFLLLLWQRDLDPEVLAYDQEFTSGLMLVVESAKLIELAARETRALEENRRYAVAQVGAALSSALNLQELRRLILELFVRLTEVDGGEFHLVEHQASECVHKVGADTGATTIYLPLVRHDQLKAHLRLVCRRPRVFSPDDVSLLESFASQAAMAIENAQIFEVEQEQAREATALLKAARAIEEGHDLD